MQLVSTPTVRTERGAAGAPGRGHTGQHDAGRDVLDHSLVVLARVVAVLGFLGMASFLLATGFGAPVALGGGSVWAGLVVTADRVLARPGDTDTGVGGEGR